MDKLAESTLTLPPGLMQEELERNYVLIKLFGMLRGQRWAVRMGSVGLSGVLAAIAYGNTGQWAWFWVLVPVALLQVFRAWVVCRRIPEVHESVAIAQWLNWMRGVSALTGLTQAQILWAFAHINDVSRGLYTLLLLSFATAAISSNAGHPGTFRPFAWVLLVPLAGLWMLVPGQHYGASTGGGVGVLVLMMLFVMFRGYSQTAWRLFDESCRIRFREHALNARLQEALDEAQVASRAKTRFLAAASHDLRQPLHVISLLAAALKMRPLDAQAADMVALLNRVSVSLNAQLSSLLDISKLDAGLVHPHAEEVDVADFVTQEFESFAPLVRAKGLEPVLQVHSHAVVMTDKALLQRILTNLCQNALKYTDQGRIVLSVRDRGERVVMSVEDTGCGIAPEEQEHVFQEFVQLGNPERDASRGLGLGLSLVKRMARLLGIEVRLVSTPGVGTKVSLRMPHLAGLGGLSLAVAEPPAAPEQLTCAGLTVLVLDDDANVRHACSILLSTLGCVALLAQDHAEAEALVLQSRPDVLMVDLRLKDGVNGIDVIHHLHGLLGPVPALLISGDTAPDRLAMAAKANIRLCTKPLTLQQLLAELALIKKQEAKPGA